MKNDNVIWRLENGMLTVGTQGTLRTFLSEEEKPQVQTIVISEGCTRIDGCVFTDCKNVTTVFLPKSLRIIAEDAFRGCNKLKNMELPEKLIGLSEGAFRDCTALEYVELPQNVHTLPKNVFRGCTGMKKLMLPESILRIDKHALAGCEAEILYRGELVEIQGDTIRRKDTKEVMWYLSEGKRSVKLDDKPFVLYDDTPGSFPGTKIVAYDKHTCNWNQQKPIHGAQFVITVQYPFYCRVGDSFWTVCPDNQFVKARLVSVLSSDKASAIVRILVLNVINWLEFVRPVSEVKKSRLRNTCFYDSYGFGGELVKPVWWQVDSRTIEVYNTWVDDCFNDYIYTDDDGIDHHIMTKFDGRIFVGDRVLGYHEHGPFKTY